MELPEKQGLKQRLQEPAKIEHNQVAVELPEKQGLKQNLLRPNSSLIFRCSGTSRKTRIETVNLAS